MKQWWWVLVGGGWLQYNQGVYQGGQRKAFIYPNCLVQPIKQNISANNQSYQANVVFGWDKVGTLSTLIYSLVLSFMN